MIIPVVYEDSKFGHVYSGYLDELIDGNKIISFRRLCGWVIIGNDPIRSNDSNIEYNGPERRLLINNLKFTDPLPNYSEPNI